MKRPMPTDPLADRLRQLTWPDVTMDRPEPSLGQLWRAAWADVACLVVVIEPPAGRTVRAAAASANLIGDDSTVVALTTGEMPVTVWADVTGSVKTCTLEHRVTDLTHNSLIELGAAVSGHRPRRWPAIHDDLDDRAVLRAGLQGRITALADAEWRPTAREGPTLAELARTVKVSPSE